MNKAEKSLRWVVNQIPDFEPTTNEEKMLVAIKLYSEAGAEEIKRLEAENAVLRERFLPCKVGDYVYDIANGTAYKTRVLEWRIFDNGHIACRTISSFPSLEEFGTRIFLKKEAAEARLAELKGDK